MKSSITDTVISSPDMGAAVQRVDKKFKAAVAHHHAGRLPQANAAYQEILAETPGYPPVLHMMGVLALQIGQRRAAIDLLRTAVAVEPGNADFRNDLGEALRLDGDAEGAALMFSSILETHPGHAGAANNLGILRHGQGHLDEAITLYRQALAHEPRNGRARMNLGVALLALGNDDAARDALVAARRLLPQEAAIALNLGNLALKADTPEEAEIFYREALTLDPKSAAAQVNLGRALKEQGRYAEALSACIAARTLSPNLPAAHWNEGIIRLLLGDFARGWKGFAWRWQADAVPPHRVDLPEWQDEDLAGKHLLVHAEQGLGDTIQFVRFLPRLQRFNPAKVTLLAQPELLKLLHGVAGADRVIGPDEAFDGCDLRVPLMDLPLRLGLGADGLAAAPYLSAGAVINPLQGPRRRVGLVWRGRPQHANDRNRSLPIDMAAALIGDSDVEWHSLQKDVTPHELARLRVAGEIIDHAPMLTDMTDTAALLATLDLLITVDTSVAHLAGALGRPVWILLPRIPDWRWQVAREDSPWYETARLFRQPARGDWASVIAAIQVRLRSVSAP